MIEDIVLNVMLRVTVRIARFLYRVDCWCHGKNEVDKRLTRWLYESKHRDDYYVRKFMQDLFDGKLKASW